MTLELQANVCRTAENLLEHKPSLRELRQQLNISQRYLAGKLGISQRAYSNLENGHTRITEYKAAVLARELNTSLDAILNQTPPAGSSSPEVHIDLLRQRLRQYEKLLQSLESQLQLKTQIIQNLIVGREIENKL
jgi:transcriptional regulator with XRE-family HTH domain